MKSFSISLLVVIALALVSVVPLSSGAQPAPGIKVLLVTGDDVEPAHNWREVSQALRQVLEASGRFQVRICEDPGVLESSASLGRFDGILLHLFNAKTPTLTEAAKANLLGFVKGGKGLVVSHLSSASFREWPEFRQLCGRYWVMGRSGHGPRGKFQARVADAQHPITRGAAGFEADDELYAKLEGDEPIHVLVEADSDWSQRTEPLAFTVDFGAGRVFHETFGHDGKALENPAVRRLICQGTEWAATGQVK